MTDQSPPRPNPTEPVFLRNFAAKWIKLGENLYTIRPQTHQATPGILIQPLSTSGAPDLEMNIIVLDETTDVLITFENEGAARALCGAIMNSVSEMPERSPNEPYHFTGIVDPRAADVIRWIEKAILSSRVAGAVGNDPEVALKATEEATFAENQAVKLILNAFHGLPPYKAPDAP